MSGPRTIRIGAPGDSLIRALGEHRPARDGWRIAPLDGPPEADGLVILDFPDAQGRDSSAKSLRAQGFTGPVLILGAAPDDEDADPEDEPIGRPVRLGALLARIDAHWAQPAETGATRLGPYEFAFADPFLRHVESGELIRLTELERKLLAYLIEAKGDLVGREQLLLSVWGYSAGVDTHTAETHIWRLRQKIETDDPQTRFLVTESGGYRLTLEASLSSS